jgi:hypothetical protein
MKRLDQGHPHPLLEHPKKNIPRPGIEPGPSASQHSSTELFEQLFAAGVFDTGGAPLLANISVNFRKNSKRS